MTDNGAKRALELIAEGIEGAKPKAVSAFGISDYLETARRFREVVDYLATQYNWGYATILKVVHFILQLVEDHGQQVADIVQKIIEFKDSLNVD